jgi:alpha-tubulin suppressor-like RCC1 family protein
MTTVAARCVTLLAGGFLLVACRQTHTVLGVDDGGIGGGGFAGGLGPGGGGAGGNGPPAPAMTVDLAWGHACALAGGAISCWGDNSNGQLGLGDTRVQQRPARVGRDADWRAIVTSDGATFAIKRDGSLWSWGANGSGQLGVGDFADRATPTRVGTRLDWTTIASRFYHACGLTADHLLWCWGRNDEGQLGQNDGNNLSDLPVPTQVTDRQWIAVGAGDGHSCAIRTEGTLWCWGRNTDGELAQPDGAPIQIRRPVQAGTDTDWEAISTGQSSNCGLRAGGQLVCWGSNANNGLPLDDPRDIINVPTEVPIATGLTAVAFNTFGGCVLTPRGQALCWGRNLEGQLGLGDTLARIDPTPLPGDGWTDVSPGRFSTCGVRGGTVLCTGDNRTGQLGDGTTDRRATFEPVALP